MKLKEWMGKNRWTVNWMAEEVRCNPTTLSSVRSGARVPGVFFAQVIVNFTNGEVTLADLGIKTTEKGTQK